MLYGSHTVYTNSLLFSRKFLRCVCCVVVQEGRTAVMYAVMGDSLEVTNYLAVSGADLTIVDNVRWTHTPHTQCYICFRLSMGGELWI